MVPVLVLTHGELATALLTAAQSIDPHLEEGTASPVHHTIHMNASNFLPFVDQERTTTPDVREIVSLLFLG